MPCDDIAFSHGRCEPGGRPMTLEQQRQGEGITMLIVPLMMFFFTGCAIFGPKTLLWPCGVKKER